MRKLFQSGFGIKLLLALVLISGAWFHFSKNVRGISALGRTIEMQNTEITGLKTSIERIQTLKSLKVDLRLKLFGANAISVSASSSSSRSGVLSGDVLALARQANVEFASMDPTPAGTTVRFWGRYSDISGFLSIAESTFPRLENFSIEKSKNGGVLLTLTVPVRPS